MVIHTRKKIVSSRTHRLQNELAELDRELDALREEAQSLEDLLLRLEVRRTIAEDEYTAKLATRDSVEGALWDAQSAPVEVAPIPPDLSEFRAVPRTLDPALEPWDLEPEDDLASDCLAPANTWRVQIAVPAGSEIPPRRRAAPQADTAPRTHWIGRGATAALWSGSIAGEKI